MIHRANDSSRGFSLIELIVVVAVMAALSAVLMPAIEGGQRASEKQSAIAKASALNAAMLRYKVSFANAESEFDTAGAGGKFDLLKGAMDLGYAEGMTWVEYNSSALFPLSFPDDLGDRMKIGGNDNY